MDGSAIGRRHDLVDGTKVALEITLRVGGAVSVLGVRGRCGARGSVLGDEDPKRADPSIVPDAKLAVILDRWGLRIVRSSNLANESDTRVEIVVLNND